VRRALVGALALAVTAAGCGGGGNGAGEATRTVEKTKVKVVQDIGRKGGFDAESIYRRLSPGVVTVISLFDGRSLLGGSRGGQGSGFVLDGRGDIATNAHVVTSGDAPNVRKAKRVYVEFTDGNRVAADIVGDDPNADVALIRVDPGGLSLTPLRLGSSSRLVVGEPVAAIGSPFGEQQSLSVGVVSALDRNIDSLTKFGIGNAIQTDAAINPGNSGGPLLDARGRVIGINAQIKSQSGGGEGVSFAIPVDIVRRSLRELRQKGHVDYGFLGVTTQILYPQLARRLGFDVSQGALVVKVEKGSPADDAGLQAGDKKVDFQSQQDIPSGGDAIVGVDGHRLTQHEDLSGLISSMPAGRKVRLEVARGHDHRQVTVTLARRPSQG
jgi:S1-C subfamily serine protease